MSREKRTTKRIFLWTCPRSCSSVFLRSIDTLSTTHAISEPFRFAFHFGPERQSQRYKSQPVDVTKSYEAVTKWILEQALSDGENVVFVKEMARYLKGRLNILEESFADAKHSFLIRNPQKVLKSQYKVSINPEIQSGSNWTYFDPGEAGFKELHELYQFVKDKLDANPVIIDADDLLGSPNQMMKAYCDGVGIQYEDHMTTWKAGEVPQAFKWDGKCSCEQVWRPFDKTFKQRQFSKEDCHHLNVTRVGTFTSNDVFDCTFECVRNALCLSISMATSRGADGRLWCELLSSDKYRDAENYGRNMVSHHFYLLALDL